MKENDVKFILMHPPYLDIINFTEHENDLSKIGNLTQFVKAFVGVCKNTLLYLVKDRYFAVIMGDVYKNGEVIPVSFYLMDAYDKNYYNNFFY